MKILQIEALKFIYHTPDKETYVLDGLELDLENGELVSIVGPSGCGKSTLLSIIAGLNSPSSGRITLCGEPIEKARGKVALMPQRDQLFPWRSVLKNVLLGLEIRKECTSERIEYAKKLLIKYGLEDAMEKKPDELSGGMRQRVALIRTLVTDPELLLLDEPFAALDFQTRINVIDDVHAIIKKEKKTAILVTHDISEAISMSDRIIVLSNCPAKVKKTIDLRPDESKSPLERRDGAGFSAYFDEIWRDLNNDG